MASIEREVTYYCDGCEWMDCKGHVARLQYQSVSDAYTFHMEGKVLEFSRGRMQAIVDLLRALDRVDSVQVGKER